MKQGIEEVGTPTPPDPDIERAKRMVQRLHVNAHDMKGEHPLMTAEAFGSVCTEAADVIELLLGKLR